MEVFEPLSAEEVDSFAARLDLHPDDLRHMIIDPLKGVDEFDLRTELESWVEEYNEEKERTKGMTLDQLNADTSDRLIPSLFAALKHAQDFIAALDKKEEEEKETRKKLVARSAL